MAAINTSKAAANHLTRELAIELAPLVRVNAVAPATVVQGSAMFPRDRVIASLAKYQIPYSEEEPTESLTQKLAQFYAGLVESEGNHYATYLLMARAIQEEETQKRMDSFLDLEAQLICEPNPLPMLH